jgi:hypothetical protein
VNSGKGTERPRRKEEEGRYVDMGKKYCCIWNEWSRLEDEPEMNSLTMVVWAGGEV